MFISISPWFFTIYILSRLSLLLFILLMILSMICVVSICIFVLLIWIKWSRLGVKKSRWNMIDLNIFILIKGVIILLNVKEISFVERNCYEVGLLGRIVNSVELLVLFQLSSALNLTSFSCSFIIQYLTPSYVSVWWVLKFQYLFIFKFKRISYCNCFVHFIYLFCVGFILLNCYLLVISFLFFFIILSYYI